jgi:YVTN family beta-propeller protein
MRLRSIWTRRRTRSAASVAIASSVALVILGGGASTAAAVGGGGLGHGPSPSPAFGVPYALGNGPFGRLVPPGFASHGFGSGPGLTTTVGNAPFAVAVDQTTHTAYVGNTNDNTVSVINTATCNATVTTSCGVTHPWIPIDSAADAGLVDAAVDEKTDTIYVVNLADFSQTSTNGAGNTVSVINGATCNASVTTGCGQVPEEVALSGDADNGVAPDGVAVDEATDTIYVADGGDNSVSVIDGATCNGKVTSGCSQIPATVTLGANTGPSVPAVDQATDTVYVPDLGTGTVSVLDGATCNATVAAGCGNTPPQVSVGGDPMAAAVDQATNTIYIAAASNSGLGSLDVIKGATCDASVTTGCGQTPASVPAGSNADDVVLDPVTHNVFVVNQNDSTVSIFDGAICNALDEAGCDQNAPVVATEFDPGYLDLDIASDSVYVANYDNGTGNTVSVLNGAACTFAQQFGCRHDAPTTAVGGGPQGSAADPATNTIYVANGNDSDLSVIDGASCNAFLAFGCRSSWPIVGTGASPFAVAVDQQTDTVYVANAGFNASPPDTVSVINGATCNAHVSSGCAQKPATVTVGITPYGVAIDEATDTIYVANVNFGPPGVGSTSVSVINGATCNATVRSGCGLTPYSIPWGSDMPADVAVDQATDTLYVTNGDNGTVSVIDGATCNGHVTSGCSKKGTINVGSEPWGLAVNEATDTVYVADQGSDAGNSGVSVIDGATCNATNQSGCSQTPATLGAGTEPSQITVDQATGAVYAASSLDSDTDVFNGSTCNATTTSGCAQTPVSVPMGGYPGNPVVDAANDTVYVPDNDDNDVSYFWAGL